MKSLRLLPLLFVCMNTVYPQDWVMKLIPDSSQAGAALPMDFPQMLEREVGRTFNSPVRSLPFRDVYSGIQDSLAALHGNVVLLSIWSTGCKPCIAEMPILCAIESQLREKGLVLLTVSMEDTARQRRFFATKGLTHPGIVAAVQMTDYQYPFQYLVNPCAYIIDRDGILRDFWAGPKTREEMVQRISKYF